MDLKAAFRARLLANEAIAAQASKIAWGGVPQGSALPYIRLTSADAGRDWTHQGPLSLVNPRVRLDMFGATSEQVSLLAAVIQGEMERVDEVAAGNWLFMPPGRIELDDGPEVEDLPGGARSYRIIHDYSFYAQPEL